jgi:hypothetical protein
MDKASKRVSLKRQVRMESDMLESEAVLGLSGKAMWVLLRFLQKRTWRNTKGRKGGMPVYDNGGLSFPYSEAESYGISTAQFYRILKILVERGFLNPEHRGGAYGRDYSTYRLSERWRMFGTERFEYMTLEKVLLPGQDVQSHLAKNAITDENP